MTKNIRTTQEEVLFKERQRLGSNYNTSITVEVTGDLDPDYPMIHTCIGINTALDADNWSYTYLSGMCKEDLTAIANMLLRAAEYLPDSPRVGITNYE